MSNKILLIGIDGIDPSILEHYRDELPTFKRLVVNGTFGKLHSTIPSVSGPAWTSMMSGKNPGKTGIIDFIGRDPLSENKGRIFNSLSVKTLRIWNEVEKSGGKSVVIGVPITFPVKKIEGVMIGGFMTSSLDSKRAFYPSSLKKKLKDKDYTFFIDISSFEKQKDEELLDLLYKSAKNKFSIINDYLKKNDWNFFTFVISETDWIQHFFEYKPNSKNIGKIIEFYKFIDKKLEKVIENNRDTNILITSDHGFGKQGKYHVYLNYWLKKEGLLKERSKNRKGKSFLAENFRRILAIPGMKLIKNFIPENLKKRAIKSEELDKADIELDKTIAYFFSSFQNTGFINIRNVDKIKNKRKLKKNIADRLISLTDSKGNKIIKEVYLDEEIYAGPYIKNCPDIALIFEKEYTGKDIIGKNLVRKIPKGGRPKPGHRMDGVLIGYGPDIKKRGKFECFYT